jgi:hypothetical protein
MKDNTPDDKSSESNNEEKTKNLLKTYMARLKLKLIANYILLALGPAIGVVAVYLAMNATGSNQATLNQLGKISAKLDSMNTALAASKNDLEKLKAAMAQEKVLHDETHIHQDEQTNKIVQSITRLQVKMKIAPTLEEQLRQAVSASTVAPQSSNTSAVPGTASLAANTVVPASAVTPAAAIKPASSVAAGSANTPKVTEKKLSPQVQSIKESIEQFNKK